MCIGVPITRTGAFVYGEGETPLDTDEDGTILISRSADDIFHPNCIASFEGKPATINHPTDFVTPVTFKELAKGHMQNVRPSPNKILADGKEEDALLADLIIQDHMAIQLVKNGLREVSLGYEAEYEQTGEGTGRQTKIRGNHIALVDKGRAGPTCAINDHEMKGKSTMSKVRDMLAKLMKVADEELKEDKKDASKDEFPKKDDDKKDDKKEDAKDEEAPSFDAVMEKFKDLAAMMDKLGQSKDEDKEDKKDEPAKDEDKEDEKKDDAKDDGQSSLEDRLKSLETAVAKLLEQKAGDSEEEEKSEDADKEDESKDDDFEESSMTGDTFARAEILAPGIKKQKDIETVALKAAYLTKEGKQVIDALSGGKPTFDSAEKCKTLFIAASEVLKSSRGNGLAGTKNSKSFDTKTKDSGAITAEKLNELNAIHFGLKK